MRGKLWLAALVLLATAVLGVGLRDWSGKGETLAEASVRALPKVAPEQYHFAVVGDTGCCKAVFREILRELERDRPLFIIHTGDVNYEGVYGYDLFRSRVEKTGIPLIAALSNHDVKVASQWKIAKRKISPENFTYDFGRFRFIFINSGWKALGHKKLEWLQVQLATPPGIRSIVVTHVPPFDYRNVAAPGAPFPVGHSIFKVDQAERFVHHMSENRVAAVFLGHIHAFKHWIHDGIDYWVTGGGGGELEPGETQHHYLRVEVKGAEIKVSPVWVGEIRPLDLAWVEISWRARRFAMREAGPLGLLLAVSLVLTRPRRAKP
ncbi:MAG: metallophosphoesterase family protein [Vicinamibacteria bacterium]